MRKLGFFNVSALIASVTVLSMAFILVPDKSWSPLVITSVALFALAVGFIFYVPTAISAKRGNTDASNLASIGPISVASGWLFLLTAGAAALAIFGFEKLAIALDIFAVGTFVISALTIHAAMNKVADVSNSYSQPSNHLRWQGDIRGLLGQVTDRKNADLIEKLAEKLRYAASDVPGGTPHDVGIDSAISEIGNLTDSNTSGLEEIVKKIEILLAKRDVFLRTARSKA